MPKKRDLEEEKKNEMLMARGRLKGILLDLAGQSDGESSDDESKKIPNRGRPPKRVKRDSGPINFPQTFVMKLFDRSVDLAKFNEKSSLYPICRAWIWNNQKMKLKIKQYQGSRNYDTKTDILKLIKTDKLKEVTALPPPNDLEIDRTPSPLPFQKESNKDNIDLNYNLDYPTKDKKQLMSEHKNRWCQVKKKWQNQSKAYEERYSKSIEILDALYKQ